jgi:hypothetical protein
MIFGTSSASNILIVQRCGVRSTVATALPRASFRCLATSSEVTYKIKTTPHEVEFGQSLGVVSNANMWDTGSVTSLEWSDGNVWQGAVTVPADLGTFEFKFVVLSNGEVVEWEECDNKSCKVNKKGTTIECSWGVTELKELEKKKATRKKSLPKKKKIVADVAPAPHSEEPVVAATIDPVPVYERSADLDAITNHAQNETGEKASHSPKASSEEIEGGVVVYTFDATNPGESAAELAKKMLE